MSKDEVRRRYPCVLIRYRLRRSGRPGPLVTVITSLAAGERARQSIARVADWIEYRAICAAEN